MKAREGVMKSHIFGSQLKELYPVVEPNLSDSGSADCVLEFLCIAGNRSLPEVRIKKKDKKKNKNLSNLIIIIIVYRKLIIK